MKIATLEAQIRGAFVWLGLLSLAFAGAFLFLVNRIDDRFDKIGGKIDVISGQIGDLRVNLAEIKNGPDKPKKKPPAR